MWADLARRGAARAKLAAHAIERLAQTIEDAIALLQYAAHGANARARIDETHRLLCGRLVISSACHIEGT
jgi:hypothetical protein